jgi:peptide/nickel transport system permease protein
MAAIPRRPAIAMESVLSFLGLGMQLPTPASETFSMAITPRARPWLAVFPGMFIFWIVLAVNLVGDGLSAGGR